jgi:hypothetical protein
MIVARTPGEWGVSVLSDDEGAMVVTPPPAERIRRIKAGEMPFTNRRIALLESSSYIGHEECVSNAILFAASKDLFKTCQMILDHSREYAVHPKIIEAVEAAMAKALKDPRNDTAN